MKENSMNVDVMKQALDKGLEFNEHFAAAMENGFDWLFHREELVQSGRTAFSLVHQGELMSVRYYDLAGETEIDLADGSRMPIQRNKHRVPLVLVPPLGVTTETFDLMQNRSLARYMAARGFRTYLIDWGKPQKRHAHFGMKDYADTMMAEALDKVREHSGEQRVSLMGWCMGGLISLIHAGIKTDPRIVNIVIVASPIDLRGGGMVAGVGKVLNTPAKLIRRFTNFRVHAIDPIKLHAPGWVTTLAFKMTDPIGSVTSYWDLVTRLWDREFVKSHTTTSDYLNNMLSYPAGMIQDLAVKVAVDNQLAFGEVRIGKKVSHFGNIKSSLLAFAGEKDNLVEASAARRIMELVDTEDKCFEIAPGGHMGVILGSKAQKTVWAQTAEWLAVRPAERMEDNPPMPTARQKAKLKRHQT
jgi:polyhydroxyalkanoate synthase